MEILKMLLIPLAIVIMLSLPFISIIKGYKTGKSAKKAIIVNLCSFFAVMALALVLPIAPMVSAETEVAVEAAKASAAGFGYLAAAIATGASCIGCGIAVASAASAAIGAVAEEPKSFVKSLIFVALGEGVAIYGVLISILILNKI